MKLPIQFAAVALLAACAHPPPPPPPSAPPEPTLRARDFYPLHVGNQWTYEVRPDPEHRPRTVEILSEDSGYFIDSMNGRLREDDTGVRDEHRYLLENPVEPGHTWIAVQSIQATEHFMITEAGHPCAVKAGTFGICAVVRMTEDVGHGKTLVLESTYAQGVGLVALRTSIESADGPAVVQTEIELLTYRLGS